MKIINDARIKNTFIFTYTHEKYINTALASLFATVDMAWHKVIVIEPPFIGESTVYDGIKKYVDVFIKTKKNYGWGQSINLGIAHVRSPYFTVVHDDVEFVERDWWQKCADLFIDNRNILIQPQRVKRGDSLWDSSAEAIIKAKQTLRTGQIKEIYCMLFPRKFVDLVGYMDERWYPVGPEDVDLLFRIKNKGYQTLLTNRAVVKHVGSGRKDVKGTIEMQEPQYISMEEKWGVPTLNEYINIPKKQLQPDILKQL